MRTFMALLALAFAVLALGVPAALASQGTGSADGLTVTVSLSDTATPGQPFTVAESIQNTTNSLRLVRVTQTLEGESGELLSFSYPILVPAGRTLSFSLTFTFPPGVLPGTYSLTLRANNAVATASTTVPEPTP
jgi:hypothetical protein